VCVCVEGVVHFNVCVGVCDLLVFLNGENTGGEGRVARALSRVNPPEN